MNEMQLSIITINYNNSEGLRHTLESVASQTYREFEHIIIDGGSSDGSVDVIKEYVHNVERINELMSERIHVEWLSEPDKGIYDAMNKGIEISLGRRIVNSFNRSELVEDKNKGIEKASGEYIYFLNSGDCLASESVVADMHEQMDGSAIIIGRVNQVLGGKIVGRTKLLSESDLSMYRMCLQGINHQSAMIQTDIQRKYLYDTSLYLSADWKFFMQTIVRDNVSVKMINSIFANYDCSGVSANNQVRIMEERKNALASIFSPRIANDYIAVLPYYYEVIRVQWLLQHPFWYKLYRGLATFARKITNNHSFLNP